MAWHSDLAGWHARAHPYPSPADFTPSRDNLAFAVLRSEQAAPAGFSLALFTPDVAVDASGSVLGLADTDFAGLVSLAQQTLDLPETGTFRNTWRVKQSRTSQPIERLLVPAAGGALHETCVQGFEKDKRELTAPIQDSTELPEVLWELFGLVEESRNGYKRGEEDKDMISKVKETLD